MMSRLFFGCAVTGFIGLTLLLSELRWFKRVNLTERLAMYVSRSQHTHGHRLSVESFRDVLAPLAHAIGEHLSQILRVGEELRKRLERVHSPIDVTGFRVKQVGWATTLLGVAVVVGLIADLPAIFSIGIVVAVPALTFMLLEQQTISASKRWQKQIEAELPLITEQLGMLLTAGWSLRAALLRVSERSNGTCARDLERVMARVHQGLSEMEALKEWAKQADVDSLYRLVSVLSLNSQASDIGRLINEEARSMRKEAQRELIETIEKRTQQVWIPVTAATLVPGVMLMGVPFIDAVRILTS